MIKLLNIDCMEYMSTCLDKQFDLAIVDPPYGINSGKRKALGTYSMKGEDTRWENKEWDNKTPDKKYFDELFRTSKNQIIWGGNYFELPISRGWVFWDKMPIVPNFSDGELAWTSFDKILKRIVIHWNGKVRTGIEKNYKAIHPSQKPIKLYKWLLINYAKEGDKIIDTHLGSGSSAIAAYDFGCDFVGCEIDKDYYDAAVKRFETHKMQLKLMI
jgi:site-specific DNA-methyltransferase (adenine-specific)